MDPEFASPKQAGDLVRILNDSEAFRTASVTWGDGFNGNVLLVFEADESDGGPLPSVLLRLEPGVCRAVERIDADAHSDAGFVFRARRGVWRKLVDGELSPASAALSGRLKIEGDRFVLLRHASLAEALVACVKSAGLAI